MSTDLLICYHRRFTKSAKFEMEELIPPSRIFRFPTQKTNYGTYVHRVSMMYGLFSGGVHVTLSGEPVPY